MSMDSGQKAIREAQKYGKVNKIASSGVIRPFPIPDCSDLDISPDADYVGVICENNTIYGTKFKNSSNKIKGKNFSRRFLLLPFRAC